MSRAKDGDTVRVHYTGKLEDGTIFDSSFEGEPLEFTIGEGRIIPGFEQAVIGMQVGESRSIGIPSDEAFGPHRQEMVMEVDRNKFPTEIDLFVGQQLQVERWDEVIPVTVAGVSDTVIQLDANHPLAGKDLVFDVELLDIAVAVEG